MTDEVTAQGQWRGCIFDHGVMDVQHMWGEGGDKLCPPAQPLGHAQPGSPGLQSRARPPLPCQNLWRCCTCRSLSWEPVQRRGLLSTAPGVVTARKEVPRLIQAAPSSGASLPPDVHRDFRRHFYRGHRRTEPHQPRHTQTRLPLLPDKDILAPTAP